MRKRLLSILLCFAMVTAMLPAFELTAVAQAKNGVQIGTYMNNEYSSSVTFNADSTFEFKMNFGEGYATSKGTWRAEVQDTGETGVFLTVTSKHTGIIVGEHYNFLSDPGKTDVLYLSDGSAGIVPSETAFSFSSSSAVKSNALSDEAIAAGKAAVLQATKANASKLVSELQSATASNHTYSGYRGLVLDSWAAKEVGMADSMKLMPDEVNDYFHESITREAFAALVHSALLKLTGITESQMMKILTAKSFPDCSNQKVGVCAGLGIITGDTAGYFRPNDTITRQEAATMLSKLADVVGAKGTGDVLSFSDVSGLWGESYIKNASTLQDSYTGKAVMGGTGNHKFSAMGVYSRQQAVVTIIRMVGVTVGTHGGKSTLEASASGTYEAVSTTIGNKISELGSDNKLTDKEIGQLFDYVKTLQSQGTISSVKANKDSILFTTSDGKQGGVVIRRNTSEEGSALLGAAGKDDPASVNSTLKLTPRDSGSLLAANTSTVASDGKLYMGNNKVLVISAFSNDDSKYYTPMKSGIEAIRKKGYEVTEITDATLTDFSKMGGGGYGMVILFAHGAMIDNNFCLASEEIINLKEVEKEAALSSNGRAYLVQEVALSFDGMLEYVDRKYYISPTFFSYYLQKTPLDDAYVHLISCSSMKTNNFAQAFLQNGAKAVTGYSDVVQVKYAAQALDIMATRLVEAKKPTLPTINIGELEKAVQQVAGTNSFDFDEYNPISNTTTTRPVLTKFVASGNKSLILGTEVDTPKQANNSPITISGSYYYNKTMGGIYTTYTTSTYANTSNQNITGIKYKRVFNGKISTSTTTLYKQKTFETFSLAPGESFMRYGSSGGSEAKTYGEIITAYTTGDPKSDSGWTTIPEENWQIMNFTSKGLQQ